MALIFLTLGKAIQASLFFTLFFCFVSCGAFSGKKEQALRRETEKPSVSKHLTPRNSYFVQETLENEVKIASYNLHNYFDAEHDEAKKDYTFLPLHHPLKAQCGRLGSTRYVEECRETDWSFAKMQDKARQLSRVIHFQGSLPDLLGVQEIENASAAEALRAHLHYENSALITNSPDKRGIDVALYYRSEKLTLLESEEIAMEGPEFERNPTRNILWAHFALRGHRGYTLGVYVNHWPSQAAPSVKRVSVAKRLRRAIEDHRERIGARNYHYVVLGDFNTLDSELPNAFHNVLQDPDWELAMMDARQRYLLTDRSGHVRKMPGGSYYYWPTNSWNRFDRILLSSNLLDRRSIEFLPESFRLVAAPFAMRSNQIRAQGNFHRGTVNPRVPWKSNPMPRDEEDRGFSDHLPVVVKLRI